MLLYDNAYSGNCYKVRLLLAHLGITVERRELSVLDRADRAKTLGGLNPARRIPTLVLDDGRALAESNAILCYLARDSELFPDEAYHHAQTLQWLFFEQYDHEPHIAVARFWAHAGLQPDAAALAAKHAGGAAALEAMERHLATADFLVAGRYTIADIALYAYTHVAPEGGFELGAYPQVRHWLQRIAEQPGHVTMQA